MSASTYPPNPEQVPEDLLKLPGSYKWRVIFAVTGIALFIIIYLGIAVMSAWLAIYGIQQNYPFLEHDNSVMRIALVAISAMLFIFTLKFLFKKYKTDDSLTTQIYEKDHPELFAFIRQLCKDTGAPFPKKIVVNEDINAAVYYDKPLLSLIMPTRKNLLIGLGLMNSVNMSQFKAIMAHEFGHFSQKSMKVGSYVYISNRIIHDMVYQRDAWDKFLSVWAGIDLRISFPAWILIGITWVLRHLFQLIYTGINLLHASLSRQMEFNADLTAVRVTGSEAIISGLARLEATSAAWEETMGLLSRASEHQLYSDNVFYHHEKAIIRNLEHQPDLVPSPDKDGFRFHNDEEPMSGMYASHPSNFKRERNAMKRFIAGPEDERSPWILMGKAEELQQAVTVKLYKSGADEKETFEFKPAEEVAKFIEQELAETTYHPQYHGIYDDRIIFETDLPPAAFTSMLTTSSGPDLLTRYNNLYGEQFQVKAKHIANLEKEIGMLARTAAQQNQKAKFTFRGKEYKAKEANQLITGPQKEFKDAREELKSFDEESLCVHLLIAKALSEQQYAELLDRYDMHYKIQAYLRSIINQLQTAEDIINRIMQSEFEHGGSLYTIFNRELSSSRVEFIQFIQNADSLKLPPLSHMEDVQAVGAYLHPDPRLDDVGDKINEQFVNGLMSRMHTAHSRLGRLHFKSLGGILNLQESLVEEWRSKSPE